MPQPFTVYPGDNPGKTAGSWDGNGNIVIPGTLTAGGTVLGGGSGVTSVTAADGTISIGGTASAPTVGVGTIAESKVTSLVGDLAAKAPLASPTFTGLVTSAASVQSPSTITYAASITPDCTTGNFFRVTLTGALTINNPTGAVDGQKIMFELIQDATGSRVVTLGAAFAFGTGIASFTATTTASKRDFLGVVYNSTAAKFFVIAVAQGY